jgi:orotate phosphoribosyltransferase-like protein
MRKVDELQQEGLTPREIGDRLLLSEFTVRVLRRRPTDLWAPSIAQQRRGQRAAHRHSCW